MGSRERLEIEVSATYRRNKRTAQVAVVVLDLPFSVRSWVPAKVAPGQDVLAILDDINGRRFKDVATIPMGARIHAVSSGLFGTDPCEGETFRLPCSDPRDVIDRVNAYSAYPPGGERGTFIFGTPAPQFLIVDLGAMRELDFFGATFSPPGIDRGVGAFGVFISSDGEDYIAVSAVEDPDALIFFSVDPPVQARFVAYYFGRCAGPNCSPKGGGSRVGEVYAAGAAQ